ncbi:DUF6929 family protein [Pseudobacter ginsenosidimutans]|uniref:Uncharacterized protein n=1 Tax=Pseudobacter ginsenosidimutans TaxID=661488 RepID=A0A4Q7N4R3_9BACT|nr:hypothetical protein [Pseudobacter ginsenosidimutans]QEC44528.1 hypothetical protein FSB84_23680 [Pseudobacter ginsenosidimutans]RZS76005.1 hypothetical protein EV199_1881 [Pseudobacter ginsenosidimutans]
MKIKLIEYKEVPSFPSGSGIEFYDDKVFLVGDDSREVMVLNKRWKEIERVPLLPGTEARVPKAVKSDLEATTVVTVNRIPRLLILGSGSLDKNRNKAILFNLDSYLKDEFDLTPFYNRIAKAGVKNMNIEAAALVEDHIILGNRGNRKNPVNQLIITRNAFWKHQQQAEITLIDLELPVKDSKGIGISGMAYSLLNDTLIFTASTEQTDNAVDDGSIGDSYMGIIENASRKIGRKSLKVNELINLGEVHELFKGFKIESVCIQSEKSNRMKLHLVADNDTGKSYLFKVRVKW